MNPIGVFRSEKIHKIDAARQATIDLSEEGYIDLRPDLPFPEMLRGLESFSHLWVIFQFHLNAKWKPIVSPPVGSKQGVLATRSPYRPNPIGMSAVKLIRIEGHKVFVGAHDILDGSPVLDIKPYIPESDRIDANAGWTKTEAPWSVAFSPEAEKQLEWLANKGVKSIRNFLCQQLGFEPLNRQKKRVKKITDKRATIAYRTWRADFCFEAKNKSIFVESLRSGYSHDEISGLTDQYGDKDLHRAFKMLQSCAPILRHM